MSIYIVKLIDWYPTKDLVSDDHDNRYLARTARDLVKASKCRECGRSGIKYHKACGHYSIPWGYGDVYCSKKCLEK